MHIAQGVSLKIAKAFVEMREKGIKACDEEALRTLGELEGALDELYRLLEKTCEMDAALRAAVYRLELNEREVVREASMEFTENMHKTLNQAFDALHGLKSELYEELQAIKKLLRRMPNKSSGGRRFREP